MKPEAQIQPELIIEPNRPVLHYWRDVWLYRELFWFLVWRDILVRYKQTAVGIAWSVIRPLLTMIVFTIVFGLLANLPSGDVPYPLLVFAAMLPWNFFANALSEGSGSLIGNASLLTKVYFPRIIIPVSSVMVALVDFAISLIIMVGIMLWYGYLPDWRIVFCRCFCCLPVYQLPGQASGLLRLMSATVISAMWCRLSYNLVCMFRLLVSQAALCLSSGGCSTP